ncbi:hypothetical protein LUX39_51205 [Actinomadura madurae]|nr:hypothetical protein [Actinomadura madurae]MCQ0020996.1 hypothetical protein [Actinomadura madurae]
MWFSETLVRWAKDRQWCSGETRRKAMRSASQSDSRKPRCFWYQALVRRASVLFSTTWLSLRGTDSPISRSRKGFGATSEETSISRPSMSKNRMP